jgi:outer membrane protein assembly factor BamB
VAGNAAQLGQRFADQRNLSGRLPVLRKVLRSLSALVLVGIIAGAVWYTITNFPTDKPRAAGGFFAAPQVRADPWKPSSKFDAEASAGFKVDSAQKDNVRLAGNQVGADWPQFNGPHRDNRSLEKNLSPRWPKGGPKLAWTSHGVGVGFSSVAVVQGVVYTMGNKGASETVIALDAGTGEMIWSTPVSWASHPSAGDGPRSTPGVGVGSVFGLGGNGDLACLDAKSGAVRWQMNIMREFGGESPGWGVCESVLIDQNRLICTPGGSKATLVALNPESGEVIWKALVPQKDHAGYASPAVAEVGGLRQYVQFTNGGTIGVLADNGNFLWRDDSASNGTANCSSPLADQNFVFTSSNYGTGGSLVQLVPNSSGVRADLVYHTHHMSVHHGDLVIVNGMVFGASDPGVLTCLDLPTGKVKWASRAAGKGSITYADGRLYLRTEQGTMILVDATGERYRELGRFDEPNRSKSAAWAHPVVAAGRLFLRDQDLLLCYDLRTPPSP